VIAIYRAPVDLSAPVAARRPLDLWSQQLTIAWAGLTVAGFVMGAVAWYLASGEAVFNHQYGPANLAVAGLIVANTAHVFWIAVGRASIAERRRMLLPEPPPIKTDVRGGGVDAAVATSDELVAGDGVRYYHRSDCPMAAERDWPETDRDTQEALGLLPCRICQP
jgi:hypothetical protein